MIVGNLVRNFNEGGKIMWRLKHAFFTVKERLEMSLRDESGIGVVEVILILVGIFTPYYGVGIRCMA